MGKKVRRVDALEMFIKNFRGLTGETLIRLDGMDAVICGDNGTGKSSVADAFSYVATGGNASGDIKFAIRPYDKDGNPIHNLTCGAQIIYSTGNPEEPTITLCRTQSEKWVKARGAAEAEFKGYYSTLEINGYPRKSEDFDKAVERICDKDAYRYLSIPFAFPLLDWKEQRRILIGFTEDRPDAELAEKMGSEFDPLLPELRSAPDLDSVKTKMNATKKGLVKRQTEIPARVDENINSVVGDALIRQREDSILVLSNKLAAYPEMESIESIQDSITEANNVQREYALSWGEQFSSQQDEISQRLATLNSEYRTVSLQVSKLTADGRTSKDAIERAKKEIANQESRKQVWEKSTFDESKWVFDERRTICPTCKRKLPESRVKVVEDEFAKQKQAAKDSFIKERATSIAQCEQNIKALNAELHKQEDIFNKARLEFQPLKAKMDSVQADIDKATGEQESLRKARAEGINADPKFIELKGKTEGLEKLLRDTVEQNKERIALQEQLTKERADLDFIKQRNEAANERAKALQEELREVSQKILDCDRILYLLEEYTRRKMRMLSDSINSHFDKLTVKLFEQQINGGVRETCVLQMNGVDYKDLSHAEKIIAGLEIIKALQELYGIALPVFIDDAESINPRNIPRLDCQIIALRFIPNAPLTVRTMEDFYAEGSE